MQFGKCSDCKKFLSEEEKGQTRCELCSQYSSRELPYHSPPLTPRPICGASDNPHEFLTITCKKCFKKQSDCRNTFQDRGWRMFQDETFPEHEGFPVCQECTDYDYSWNDLY